MPGLSYFYGIAIYIYWDDHNPPHYHAIYGEHEAWIVIADASVLHGSLPDGRCVSCARGTACITAIWRRPGRRPRPTRRPVP